MYCKNCGKQIDNDAKFCYNCRQVIIQAQENSPDGDVSLNRYNLTNKNNLQKFTLLKDKITPYMLKLINSGSKIKQRFLLLKLKLKVAIAILGVIIIGLSVFGIVYTSNPNRSAKAVVYAYYDAINRQDINLLKKVCNHDIEISKKEMKALNTSVKLAYLNNWRKGVKITSVEKSESILSTSFNITVDINGYDAGIGVELIDNKYYVYIDSDYNLGVDDIYDQLDLPN